MKPRLAVVISHPIQHFAPVYRIINEHNLVDVRVFYLSDAGARCYKDADFDAEFAWDIDLLSGYSYEVLQPATSLGGPHFWNVDDPKLSSRLDAFQPHAVLLYGYSQAIQWRGWIWAKQHNAAILYFSDSSHAALRGSWLKRLMKEVVVRFFLKSVDIFLTTGDQNADYLAHYGADRDKMCRCPLSVDIDRFQAYLADRTAFILESRAELGISAKRFTVLFSGKMVPRKRPMDIIRAMAILHEQSVFITAIFAGSGPLAESLEQEADNLGISELCIFPGFVNQRSMVKLQYAADVLIIPSSYDPHPLVVTEAAVCGLPIIASDAIGCVGPTDTVQEGVNALTYPCADVSGLAKAILTFIDNRALCAQMGAASIRISKTQSTLCAATIIENEVIKLYE